MSFRRALASMLVATFVALSVGGSHLTAQVSSRGTSLLVPITGVADQGGMFSGALLIQRFAAQAKGIAALGTVTGTLVANGTGAPTALGSLLCSVDHFRDVSNPATLVQQLNGILAALGAADGS